MPRTALKTSLLAAFFYATILSGCSQDQPGTQVSDSSCPAPNVSIASVQGDAPTSSKLGQQVMVQGIVTLVQDKDGLYIEEPDSDSNSRTSNAIFVQFTNLPDEIKQGSVVSARGFVSEIGNRKYPLTALTKVDMLIRCESNRVLPLTDTSLPLNGLGREALEGMRIRISEPLTVTDVYQFGRGNFTLSGNGLQFVPTEVQIPGADASRQSAKNRGHALPVNRPAGMDQPGLLVNGTSINDLTGILAHDGRELRVSLQSLSTGPPFDFPPPPRAVAGSLRVVGMNLHNYFNGDGNGRGYPTPRGAESFYEFQQQRDRIGAAIEALEPHIIGVMELENDGFGSASAIADLIRLANDATGKPWVAARPDDDNTGTDQITVGLIFRGDLLEAVGPAQTLTGIEFTKSRQPLAQLFRRRSDQQEIMIIVNHLKSKGSCPDSGENAKQKDGQGCWNPMRVAAAKRMSAWAKSIALAAATDNILILGDMNAYRKEQPIDTIRAAGFTELMDDKHGETYSFAYYGQHGTLDYAFSSDALLEEVQQAFIWHVNAAFPVNMELPQPWLGFSDHDPVVIDIRSRH